MPNDIAESSTPGAGLYAPLTKEESSFVFKEDDTYKGDNSPYKNVVRFLMKNPTLKEKIARSDPSQVVDPERLSYDNYKQQLSGIAQNHLRLMAMELMKASVERFLEKVAQGETSFEASSGQENSGRGEKRKQEQDALMAP